MIGVSGLLIFAGGVWLATAQLGAQRFDPRPNGEGVSAIAGKVDLNVAGMDELIRLPGMTPQLAEDVIRNRPYRKLDDLITKKVLGKKQFARIRDHVVVGRDKP
ncbi:MAG TPA: helix-hairpin-helix domain-containing protein [Candidatus Methylomirabilis sp.]|nr:helix-hairpin-helix domain-containing protein [Candidatus Methylomirabilis sp.]